MNDLKQSVYNIHMEELHKPVLLHQVLEVLAPRSGESYLDLTAGYAGHAKEILDVTRNYKASTLVDRDENAIKVLENKFSETGIEILHEAFYDAVLQEIECGKTYDLILMDFGVSSPQLDRAERGFSFMKEGPLDMRMDQTGSLNADKIINGWREKDLASILMAYGEIKPGLAKLMAREIVHHRPFKSTLALGEFLKRFGHHAKVHPATRVFQAVRIVVNDELKQIEKTLELVPQVLNPGGRVAMITFHSLEDRLVKNWLSNMADQGEEAEIEAINKKPIVAEDSELFINPRARSAKLRAARKR